MAYPFNPSADDSHDGNYRAFHDAESGSKLEEQKNILECLWERYKYYSDENFINEFTRHFHHRFWEMYIGSFLLMNGHEMGSCGSTGPDCKILHDGAVIWFEAVCASEGTGDDQVPELKYGDAAIEKIILRVRSTIEDKSHKYNREHLIN